MSDLRVWCNGRFLPQSEAVLPWTDTGFVYGAVLVDNARTFRRQLFRWPQHLERFRRHCTLCGLALPYSDDQLSAAAEELIALNSRLLDEKAEMQVVTFATPGPLGWLVGKESDGPPTIGMMAYPLPRPRYRRFFSEGVTLEITGQQHSHPSDILPPAIKHRSRLMWYLAERRKRLPAAVPVLVNQEGIGDTAVGAIVAVLGGTVLLPPADAVLESISVQCLRELCRDYGIPVRESLWDLRELAAEPSGERERLPIEPIQELLLVGTAFCIAGVRRLVSANSERYFPWPGEMYSLLLAAWEQHVGASITHYFLDSAG
jgi:branched-chain amino acid aminotransferase